MARGLAIFSSHEECLKYEKNKCFFKCQIAIKVYRYKFKEQVKGYIEVAWWLIS